MNKIIREATFETNSSSSHSLTLGSLTNFNPSTSLIPDHEGVVYLDATSYIDNSSGYQLTDPRGKINYYLADRVFCGYSSTPVDGLYQNLILKESWRLLEAIVKYQTGAKEVRVFTPKEEEEIMQGLLIPEYSTVDHESVGLLENIKDVFSLHSFIFNTATSIKLDYNG